MNCNFNFIFGKSYYFECCDKWRASGQKVENITSFPGGLLSIIFTVIFMLLDHNIKKKVIQMKVLKKRLVFTQKSNIERHSFERIVLEEFELLSMVVSNF